MSFNQYQPNIENMQQYLSSENEKSSGTGSNWWSIPKGMSSVRILPPWDPTGRVALPVFMHPIEFKGKDMSYTKYNWTCVNNTFNKPCAICEGLANLAASGVDISEYEANRRQYYFNAIVMHDPTYNQREGTAPGTHVVMKAPKTLYNWVISQITNPMIGDITNTQNGIDVYITKEGEGLGTTYSMTLSPNGRTPIPPDILASIKDLYNLDDVFSAGFDQAQIDELVDSLKKSAGVMSNGVGQAINQMAGYTQTPMNQQTTPVYNPGYQQPQQIVQPPVTQFAPAQMPVFQAPAPTPYGAQPSPMMQSPVQPVQQPSAQQPQAPTPGTIPTSVAPQEATAQNNMPKCFGQYDAGNVNCVVCPMEIQCSQSKG